MQNFSAAECGKAVTDNVRNVPHLIFRKLPLDNFPQSAFRKIPAPVCAGARMAFPLWQANALNTPPA